MKDFTRLFSRSIAFLFVLYTGLFLLDSCRPKCPPVGQSTLDYFFVEQLYETNSGVVIEADEEGFYLLEKASTLRYGAVVKTTQVAQHVQTSIFSAYALSCVELGLLMSDSKLDPESIIISIDQHITIDSLAYAAGSNLNPSQEIELTEDGFNNFYVSLSDEMVQSLTASNSLFELTVAGETYDGISFTVTSKLQVAL
jgi:hypothetical protein